ncbi:M14 family metallopeptidase [soil metagenome]
MKLAFAALALAACQPWTQTVWPSTTTIAESSGYQRTGRYAEVAALCHDFARTYREVTCLTIGETGEGRPIYALKVEKHKGLRYIYVEGGIHAGEIEGKDAGFAFVRDLLDGKTAPGARDAVSLVFVPVINPDGHERFSKNNRPNQRGPEEMGFRTNGARQNINRDWVKADAPETRAALAAMKTFDPFIGVDLHTTDGAKFETDISITMVPIAPRADQLDRVAAHLSSQLIQRVRELGNIPVDFYPSFNDAELPESGFAKGEPPPRFSTAYMATRGRIGILVETHSWRTYPERVASTYHTLQALFEEAVRQGAFWNEYAQKVDAKARKLGGTEVVLAWQTDPTKSHDIAFRGYAYERTLSELTGGVWLKYDEKSPQTFTVPLYDTYTPKVTAIAPLGGYIVDGGFAKHVAEVLDAHGIRYARAPAEERHVDVYRGSATFQPPYEGRTRATITGEWTHEKLTLEQGAIYVPIDQPLALLVMQLLEPAGLDSLAQWGEFNACFEQKEYAEPYVLEQAAREMFTKDPALAAEYADFVSTSPSTDERLLWIYKHHPSWDDRMGLLPIYRLNSVSKLH